MMFFIISIHIFTRAESVYAPTAGDGGGDDGKRVNKFSLRENIDWINQKIMNCLFVFILSGSNQFMPHWFIFETQNMPQKKHYADGDHPYGWKIHDRGTLPLFTSGQ